MRFPTVVWDPNLPPIPQKSPEEEEVDRWEQWFNSCGMTREWAAVKAVYPDDIKAQLAWAKILELNRLNNATAQGKEDEPNA